MKKYIFKAFSLMALFLIAACSEDTVVDEVIDSVTNGGALRNLGVDNDLDISDGSSTYSIILEAQDANGGNLLQEVRVNVGFNDIDDAGTDSTALSLYTTIPASSFTEESPTTNNLPVATFSVTLDELLNHINSSSSDVSVGDDFVIDFEMVLTDGRIFNLENATQDVTRTGFFSYFNSQFRYAANIGDPQRVVLSTIEIDDDNELGILKDGDTDMVILTFDREDPFVVAPTITRTSAIGATDDVIGTLVQSSEDPEEYSFSYEAGASAADTVSFTISGGETVAGFTMASKTLSNAYIIDNTGPAGSIGATTVSADAGGRILNVSFELIYEPLDGGSINVLVEDNNAVFEPQTLSVTVEEGQEVVLVQFVPQDASGVALPEGALDFDVTFTDITDVVGNVSTDVVTVQLGN